MAVMSIDRITVECDECGETIDIPANVYSGDNCTHSEMYGLEYSDLEEYGWTWDGNETYCKECSKENEDVDE